MKIAVTYEDGNIYGHFGHTQQFKIYTVEQGMVVSSEVVPTGDSGHGALAGFLKERGVDTLICGGIGGGARTALAQACLLYTSCWMQRCRSLPRPCGSRWLRSRRN